MSDPGLWAQIKRLFVAAAELDAAEREAFLDREVGHDPELRERVRALLAADAEASGFLQPDGDLPEGPAADASSRWIGRRFGAYEVVGELGRGGMGVVLLARRADGRYDREVALKVVPAALVEGHLEARFRDEVRILAELDHPNVARLLDAGESPEGLAYLVMEYVDGPRIDVYADERSLDLRTRLRLFRQVLDGVDYAHAHGVVHRDLKPSNILVTRDGVVKLVDFGIAKLLDPTGASPGPAPATRTGHRMLTPEYASPEQVRGDPVDPRSDVYSLGVVLYRLLTGRPPYTLDSTEPRSAERVICDQTPSRPSDAATRTVPVDPDATHPVDDPDVLARQRSSTRDRLRRSLRGDLDTIVLHALAKEPGLRYATAGAFADDIDRHLDGRVIRARNPGPVYRAQRLLRRRWLPVAASAAALLAAGAVARQTREAEAQRQVAAANSAELTSLVGSVLSTLNTDLAGENQGPTATRTAAVETAVTALDSVAARAEGPPGPDLLAALAAAYQEVGMLQGHPTSANVGRVDDAVASFETSLDLWRRLAATGSGGTRPRLEIAETQVLLSDIHRTRGENSQAGALLDQAEATVDSVLAEVEPDVTGLSVQAMVYERQAQVSEARGDFAATEGYVTRLTHIARRTAALSPPGPSRLGTLEEVALALQYESYVLSRTGDLDGAIRAQLDAARLADSIADVPGATQRMEGIRAGAWNQLGWRYNDADRPDDAVAAFDRAIDLMRPLRAADPGNLAAVGALGTYLAGRGQAHIRADRWEAALADHREAIQLLEPMLAGIPSLDYAISQSWRQIGEALAHLGRFEEAAEAHNRSLTGQERLFRADTTSAAARKTLALARFSQAIYLRLRARGASDPGFCEPAAEAEARAVELWSDLRARGQIFPGEEIIWTDFTGMMPAGICG